MEVLFHVTTKDGAQILLPLVQACARSDRRFACFFTNEGVLGVREESIRAALEPATRAVACEESWRRFCPGLTCPIEPGSQTINSALMGQAVRVVSL